MKIRIDVVKDLAEDEVIIRCSKPGEAIARIQHFVMEQAAGVPDIVFYRDNTEYYFPLSEVLFFETEGDLVYAHTQEQSYRVKLRLYELEQSLPGAFVRASKSAILNTGRVHSITRNLASSSLVEFAGTHKRLYVSRRYYSALKERLMQRSSI